MKRRIRFFSFILLSAATTRERGSFTHKKKRHKNRKKVKNADFPSSVFIATLPPEHRSSSASNFFTRPSPPHHHHHRFNLLPSSSPPPFLHLPQPPSQPPQICPEHPHLTPPYLTSIHASRSARDKPCAAAPRPPTIKPSSSPFYLQIRAPSPSSENHPPPRPRQIQNNHRRFNTTIPSSHAASTFSDEPHLASHSGEQRSASVLESIVVGRDPAIPTNPPSHSEPDRAGV